MIFLEKKNMKKSYLIIYLALLISGCESSIKSPTQSDIAISSAIDTKTTLVDASLDEQDRKIMEKTSPRTVERMDRKEPLTINDIIKLSQSGINDDTIMIYIQKTKTTYNLSQAQINRLQEAGVSQRVINYMVSTGK